MDRLLLVLSSPRLPAGMLSWPAWEALRSGPVFTSDAESAQARAVRAAGVPVEAAGADAVAFRDRVEGTAVWLAGPDGDARFVEALRALPGLTVDVVEGSWDPPGARLLDAAAVMDRLRSPGGCPWDAEQTHETLAPYLIEETYELLEAIEDDDRVHLREELGDVLLQVLFHARLAQEESPEPFSIDEVAEDLVAKLVRRHPHVFADRAVAGAAEVAANWDEIKAVEKRRESVTDGVPLGQPALALAAKLRRRAIKAGLDVPPPVGDDIGSRLFALVGEAIKADVDPEAALRAASRAYRDGMRAAEGVPAAGATGGVTAG